MTRKGLLASASAAVFGLVALGGLAVSDVVTPLGTPALDTVGNILIEVGVKLTVHVGSNAELAAYRYHANVIRDGFAAPGDGGRATYNWSSSPCAAADGGTQIAGSFGGCWTLDPSVVITPRLFGAVYGGLATSGVDTAAVQSAVATGATVHLDGAFTPNAPIIVAKPGQLIYGNGRMISRVNVQTLFSGLGEFVFTGSEPGPILRDIGLFFVQPTTTIKSSLIQYPPAIYAEGISRFRLEHVGCYEAWFCVDAYGNAGGSTIDDLQMSPYQTGIKIDGSTDTVRLTDVHAWPFAGYGATRTNNVLANTQIFYDGSVNGPLGLDIGRVDGLYVEGYLGFIGQALNLHAGLFNMPGAGPGTTGFGTFADSDFDTFTGAIVQAGDWKFDGDDFTVGVANGLAYTQTGGKVQMSSPRMFLGTSANTEALVNLSGGSLAISTPSFNTIAFDASSIQQTGGNLTVGGAGFYDRSSNVAYAKPTINILGGCASIQGQQTVNDKGTGAGTFINVGADGYHRIIGNVSPGWADMVAGSAMGSSLTPTASGGIYAGN